MTLRDAAHPLDPNPSRPVLSSRRALTLAELLIGLAITAMIVGGAAAVVRTVRVGSDYSYGHGAAIQHGRVLAERIGRAVRQAAATDLEPPLVVLADEAGAWRFPDTLVVWKSDANADQAPQVSELVLFCPNPNTPNVLWELTAPGDSRTVSLADAAALAAVVSELKSASSSQKIELTTLAHTATVAEDNGRRRAALRLEADFRPTAAEWASLQGGTADWNSLSWAQGIYGSKTGLRQAWVRFELLLDPANNAAATGENPYPAIPFFGSATRNYELHR
jgi:hypothetical protein